MVRPLGKTGSHLCCYFAGVMDVVKRPVASPASVSVPETIDVVNAPVSAPVMVEDGPIDVVKSSVASPHIISVPAGAMDVV